jgi:large subunit ribosomal protein L7/L12
MATKYDQLLEEIGKMSVLDLADLVKAFETKFNVSAAAPVASAAAAPQGGATAQVQEKQEYKITLQDVGASKLAVMKKLRELKSGLGLVEAKQLVENLPSVIGDAVPKADAEKWKTELTAAGAKISVS